ncbi:MAG: hypothetical protein PHF13_06275 [Acholeplasmataceae bacterium]|jgi:hypothetical protein|nr:hypothetical protein [Acholeplasmataceae bacterium]
MPGKRYRTYQGRILYVKTIFIGSSFIAQTSNSKSGYTMFRVNGVNKYLSEEAAQEALDAYAAEQHFSEIAI